MSYGDFIRFSKDFEITLNLNDLNEVYKNITIKQN